MITVYVKCELLKKKKHNQVTQSIISNISHFLFYFSITPLKLSFNGTTTYISLEIEEEKHLKCIETVKEKHKTYFNITITTE